MIPRTYLTQGVLGGGVFAIGYGLGVLWRWLWSYLELPTPRERTLGIANSIRELMGLEPVTSGHPFKVCMVAVATFAILLGLARLFTLIYRLVAGRARHFVPRRVANVIGAAIALLLFWSLATNVVFAVALRVVDASFQQFDALIEPTAPQPTSRYPLGESANGVDCDQ